MCLFFDKRGALDASKSAEKISYCFTRNLRLVLAPASRTLIFSIGTHPRARACKRPKTGAQKYRHDISMKVVYESRIQEPLGLAETAGHLNCLIVSSSFCLGDCRLHPVRLRTKIQVPVLSPCNARRVVGQHENRHLEFVVAGVRDWARVWARV